MTQIQAGCIFPPCFIVSAIYNCTLYLILGLTKRLWLEIAIQLGQGWNFLGMAPGPQLSDLFCQYNV